MITWIRGFSVPRRRFDEEREVFCSHTCCTWLKYTSLLGRVENKDTTRDESISMFWNRCMVYCHTNFWLEITWKMKTSHPTAGKKKIRHEVAILIRFELSFYFQITKLSVQFLLHTRSHITSSLILISRTSRYAKQVEEY